MRRNVLSMVLGCFSMISAGTALGEEVKLNGATTTVNAVINPHKAAVEKATGLTLSVVGNATGKGLVDLVEGRCDASLISEPLDIGLMAAKAAGKEIKEETLQLHVITNAQVVFVVHPSNPVSSLTWAQVKDIHTGKIKNWKEVGGADLPIQVFADAPTGGTRALIRKVVMNGEEMGANVKALDSVRLVNDRVAESKSGFGGLGDSFVDKNKVKVISTDKVVRPLGIVTIGAPSPKVKKVIDELKKVAGK